MGAPFRKSANSGFVLFCVYNVTMPCRSSAAQIYLYYWDSRANIYKQVGEDVRMCMLEPKFRISMFGIHKSFMGDILQNKVASLDQTSHFILFVHSKRKKYNWITITTNPWIPSMSVSFSVSYKISLTLALTSSLSGPWTCVPLHQLLWWLWFLCWPGGL